MGASRAFYENSASGATEGTALGREACCRARSYTASRLVGTLPFSCPLDATNRSKGRQAAARGESDFDRCLLVGVHDSAMASKKPHRAANASCSAC